MVETFIRTASENMISYWWMKEIYSKLPYHYKKNLKGNTFWATSIVHIYVYKSKCRLLHCPSLYVDKTDLLVVHDLHGPGHQAEAAQCLWGENKALREHSQLYNLCHFKVKELDSIIHSTEFDIPMFIQEYDMSINGLRYYQPWAMKMYVTCELN